MANFTKVKSKKSAKQTFKNLVRNADSLFLSSSDSDEETSFKYLGKQVDTSLCSHDNSVEMKIPSTPQKLRDEKLFKCKLGKLNSVKPRVENPAIETICSSHSKPLGLLNPLGNNICFFNSVIQSLFNLTEVRQFVLESCQESSLLRKIFMELNLKDKFNSPLLLSKYVKQISLPQFSFGQHYDAHECLVYLLQLFFPVTNNSFFSIEKKRKVICENCDYDYFIKSELCFDLQLNEFESDEPISIFEAIQTIQLPYRINEYVCEMCKTSGSCSCSDYISSTGQIMVINLKLVQLNNLGVLEKIHPSLIIEEKLTFGGCLGNWSLNSIIYHHGKSFNSGHYTSSVKHGEVWYHIDDSQVSKTNFESVSSQFHSKTPCILFYTKDFSNAESDLAVESSPDITSLQSSTTPYQEPYVNDKKTDAPDSSASIVSKPCGVLNETLSPDDFIDGKTPLVEDENVTDIPSFPSINFVDPLKSSVELQLPISNSVVRCSTQTEVDHVIKEHQLRSNVQFYNGARTSNFGSFCIQGCRVMFRDLECEKEEQVLTFDGIPFMSSGRFYLPCTHGKDTNFHQKEKLKSEKNSLPPKGAIIDHDFCQKKRRKTIQKTRKKNCKATVVVREVVFFPKHKIEKDSKHFRRVCSEKLRTDLELKGLEGVPHEKCFIVLLPPSSSHSGHAVDFKGGLSQHIDKRLCLKIKELVQDGVTNLVDVKRHLTYYVKKELLHGQTVPHMFTRSLFPLDKDLRNHIYNAKVALRLSKFDQENLELQINEWQKSAPNDSFFFRGYGEKEKTKNGDFDDYLTSSASTRLLFLYQTQDQKYLMQKYGNHICLLDATYKTTRYAVPLFFVVVKTNIDYQVVASFAIQDETTECITEALLKLSEWNPNWNPLVFMVDKSDQEINAISNVFTSSRILLCDFHREQSWLRWLKRGENGLTEHRKPILDFLRKIKVSRTEHECESKINELKSSEFWKTCEHFRSWFQPWLDMKDKWVNKYRLDLMEIIVHTNNGVETKNRDFKRNFLAKFNDRSLSGMVKVLVEQFCPTHFYRYTVNNFMQSDLYKEYNEELVRPYMDRRPSRVIEHLSSRLGRAIQEIKKKDIVKALPSKEDETQYYVKGKSNVYIVSFGNTVRFPSCTCEDWWSFKLPCKHMLAIIEFIDDESWESISLCYRSSPYFKLDTEIVPEHQPKSIPPIDSLDFFPDDSSPTLIPQTITEFIEEPKLKLSSLTEFRDVVKELNDMSYLMSNPDGLDKWIKSLKEIRDDIRNSLPSENGLTLELDSKEKKSGKAYSVLPRRKKKEVNRVGIGAEKRKEAGEIDISSPKKRKVSSKSGQNAQELKYTLFNEHGLQIFRDISHEVVIDKSKKLPSGKKTASKKSATIKTFFKKESMELCKNVKKTMTSLLDRVELKEFQDKMSCDIVESEIVRKHKQLKRKNLNYDLEEDVRLLNGGKLSDISINLAHNLLSLQFPHFSGFQNSLKGSRNRFQSIAPGSKYVQILNDKENDHWICVANINEGRKENEEHFIYDTALDKVSPCIARQIANFSQYPGYQLILRLESVHKQHNGVDCGVYAIAIATCLVLGIDPKFYKFDQDQMRAHLRSCFIAKKMSIFPGEVVCAKRRKVAIEKVNLYCICRLPYCEKDSKMVLCNGPKRLGCREWFHQRCVQIDPVFFTKKGENLVYLCPLCTQNSKN